MSTWLHGTTLSWAARGGWPWLWPLCETLHFVGMAMLIGIVGLLDLRMLGFVKGVPLRPLQRLLPWGCRWVHSQSRDRHRLFRRRSVPVRGQRGLLAQDGL